MKQESALDFRGIGIQDSFVKGLKEMGFRNPSPIQAEAIPLLLQSPCDMVAQAQTGTGKTAAFGLPLLQSIDPKQSQIQAVVLSPTRELAQQIAKQFFKFTKYTDRIFTEAVYGGAHIDQQIKSLQRPTHILVATPGRMIDLMERKAVSLDTVQYLVLDEADEMLSLGFKQELDRILLALSSVRSKWLFSATLPQGIQEIVRDHISPEAHRIEIKGRSVVNSKIQHQFVICEDSDKLTVCMRFLKSMGKERGLIFCRTKAITQELTETLQAKGLEVVGIHGDLQQRERDKVMRAFKKERAQVLVATDLTARGIDVPGLAYVLHYQLPDKDEYYTHRSGRTARAGREGLSLCLVNRKEVKQLRFLERKLRISFSQLR